MPRACTSWSVRRLADVVRKLRPDVDDAEGAIADGRVLVDGRVIDNPASLVRPDAAVSVRTLAELRGSVKLRAALEAFQGPVTGRVCLDCGAATGGFTDVLLQAGALRVYAVDAGVGQLLGRLRQDPRVVNLESTNLAVAMIEEPLGLVTLDLSYLSL